MFFQRKLFRWCIFILSGLGLPAMAADMVVERAWLEDASGQKTYAQVQAQALTAYEGVLSRGFGTSAIWVKLRVAQPQSQSQASGSVHTDDLVLRIRPVYLDDVQVYDQGKLVGQTGDRHHPADQTLKGLDFMVALPEGPLPRDIWLRVQSTSTRQLFAEVISEKSLLEQAPYQHLLFSLYVAIILIFTLWGLSYWAFTRDALVGLFGFKQWAALVYALCSLGFMRMWWPQDCPAAWLDHMSSLFSMLATSAAIYYHLVFLRDYQPRTWLRWLMWAMVGLFPLNLFIFYALDAPVAALQINLTSVLLAPPVFLLTALTAQGWQQPPQNAHILLPRQLVIGFYSVLLAILVIAALPGLGLARGGEIGLYLVQAHGLASGLMVMLLLQYRAHLLRRAQFEAHTQLERVRLQSERDRLQREEQEKLMAMLTHELKTPLSTMYMRLDETSPQASAIKQSIRDMNNVIERCVQMNRLEDQKLQAHMEQVDVAHVVRDVLAASAEPYRFSVQLDAIFAASDRQLLHMILSNLIENACKYSPAASSIELALQDMDAVFQLKVCNLPGRAGWPDADRVFGKYYRSSGAQGKAGTGLGLFLAHSLAKTLGGSLTYQPTSSQVCFVLTLPKN
jgi:signal transduction histidine kinase